jgi:hypothetical protein
LSIYDAIALVLQSEQRLNTSWFASNQGNFPLVRPQSVQEVVVEVIVEFIVEFMGA